MGLSDTIEVVRQKIPKRKLVALGAYGMMGLLTFVLFICACVAAGEVKKGKGDSQDRFSMLWPVFMCVFVLLASVANILKVRRLRARRGRVR